jgi:hypothetical protein
LGGVALEITMQSTLLLGNRQLIVWTCEVIHADKLIAGLDQLLNVLLKNI